MRHGLNDGTGHCRHPALRVVAIEEFAPLPLLVDRLHVVGDDGEQLVGQVARGQTGTLGTEYAVEEVGGTNRKRASVGLPVWGVASVSVYGQREFDGHFPSCAVRQVNRASCQQVGHAGTGVDVVAVVVLSVFRAVNGVGHTSPLGIVACALEASWQQTHLSVARDVSHSSANAHAVGRDGAVAIAEVVEHDTVTVVAALVELKRAEVNPCGAAHLLVDAELGRDALVPHRVMGIVDTALNGLVAHIDGIAACLWDVGIPGDGALGVGVVDGACLSGRTRLEGVLFLLVAALVEGKAGLAGGIPVVDAFGLLVS